jgi:uncharacterized protein (DUF2249 family)
MADCELDVRALRKPDRHPAVFREYGALAVGGTLVLISEHDPWRLREEFEVEHSGSFAWDYLAWLPRRSRRQVTAGPDGLRYLTVHQRRKALTLTTAPETTAPETTAPETTASAARGD